MTGYIIDSDENSDYMYNTIDNIIKDVGPRAPCSKEEKAGSEWVKRELDKFCDNTEMENFFCRPGAFLGYIRVCMILAAVAYILFQLTIFNQIVFPTLSFGIGAVLLIIFWGQFFGYKPIVGFLFKEKQSQNVIGKIKPKGEIKKRIIFAGHIDSAHRFNLIQYTRHGYAYFAFTGVVSLICFLPVCFVQLIYGIIGAGEISMMQIPLPSSPDIITIIFLIVALLLPAGFLLLFISGKKTNFLWGGLHSMNTSTMLLFAGLAIYSYVTDVILIYVIGLKINMLNLSTMLIINWLPSYVALFFFVSKKAVPGAMDNLTAVAICLCIAKILKEWKADNPDSFPKNTEIQLVIVGCEEAGLRGSIAFARKHQAEYKNDTTIVNLESITDSKALHFFTREDTTGTDLDKEIVNDLVTVAKELKINYRVTTQPGLTGGTDAAGFVIGGLRATSIEGMIWEDYLISFHTDRDNIDYINKERRPCNDHGTNWKNRNVRCALENALKVCMGYIKLVDNREV